MRTPLYNKKCDQWVKRIVGLPGETVTVMDNCKVKINGNDQHDTYFDGSSEQCKRSMFGKIRYYKLNDGEYFVLGDNRTNSYDSRVWECYHGARSLVESFPRSVFHLILVSIDFDYSFLMLHAWM